MTQVTSPSSSEVAVLRSLELPLVPALALRAERAGDALVLRVTGELVAGRCEAVSAWALRSLEIGTPLVVDLGGVTALDASGLGVLVALRRRTSAPVLLHRVPDALRAALQRAGVLALLPETAADEALAA